MNNPSGELLTPRLLLVPNGGVTLPATSQLRSLAPACVALGSAPGRFAYRSPPTLSRLVILDELLTLPLIYPRLPLRWMSSPFTGGGC